MSRVFLAYPISSPFEDVLHRFGGWADRQLPDGTVDWTARRGLTYITEPGGALFFPVLAIPTGELVLPTSMPPTGNNRGPMMPTRQRTRTQERAARIARESTVDESHIAAETTRRAKHLATCILSLVKRPRWLPADT
jgi:hypothetical protein